MNHSSQQKPQLNSFTRLRLLLQTSTAVVLAPLILLAGGCRHGASESTGSSAGSSASSSVSSSSSGSNVPDFEGVVNMKSDMGGRPAALTLYMKKGRVRTETKLADLPAGEVIQLWDYSSGKTTSIMPAQKAYITMDLKSMATEMKKNGTNDYKFPKLTDTGKKETIAGRTCEHYLVGDEQNVDMCMAKGLGYFGNPAGFGSGSSMGGPSFSPEMMANASPEWKQLLDGGAFPLKLSMIKNGQTQFSLEVTRVEAKNVDDSLFVIPPGYKEMKTPTGP